MIEFLLENKYIIATIIIVITLLISILLKRILVRIMRMAAKTKTKLDDIIISHTKIPIRIIILLVGFFIAIKYMYPGLEVNSVSIDQIFGIIWVLVLAFLVSKITAALFEWYTEELQHKIKRKIDKTIFVFIKKIISILIYLIALLVILSRLGIEITPMLAGLGIGGLAVALALKDTLANFFGALFITIDRPMKLGDYIELDEKTAGYVVDVGWRTTRIRTWDNNYLIIPNSKIADAQTRNYNAPKMSMLIPIACGVAYNSDLDKVEKIAVEVAKKILGRVEGGVKDFEPTVRFKKFGDSSINFTVILKVKDRVSKFLVRHEFIKALHKRFKKEKIKIPFPQRDIWMRKS